MPKLRTAVHVGLVVAVAGVALGCVAVTYLGCYQRTKADHLLRDLYQMKLNIATYEAAHDLAARYGGHAVGACTREKCRFDILIRNGIYEWLRLARPKTLAVGIFVKDNRVDEKSFAVVCSPSKADQFPLGYGVSITDDSCYPCFQGQNPFLAKQNGVDPFNPEQLIVELTGASTLEQRRAAYALDLSCLSEFGDGARLDKTAPLIWQVIQKGSN
jgi:hypothetical protein